MKLLASENEDIEINLSGLTVTLTFNFADPEIAANMCFALIETAKTTGGMHIRAGTAKLPSTRRKP